MQRDLLGVGLLFHREPLTDLTLNTAKKQDTRDVYPLKLNYSKDTFTGLGEMRLSGWRTSKSRIRCLQTEFSRKLNRQTNHKCLTQLKSLRLPTSFWDLKMLGFVLHSFLDLHLKLICSVKTQTQIETTFTRAIWLKEKETTAAADGLQPDSSSLACASTWPHMNVDKCEPPVSQNTYVNLLSRPLTPQRLAQPLSSLISRIPSFQLIRFQVKGKQSRYLFGNQSRSRRDALFTPPTSSHASFCLSHTHIHTQISSSASC